MGAGDGYQSTLLRRYTGRLISTELNADRLQQARTSSVDYRVCDAEAINQVFGKQQFDLVFSSNLLEHINDPGRVLRGVADVLKDDGVTIHLIPSPFWKLCDMALYVPDRCLRLVELLTDPNGFRRVTKKIIQPVGAADPSGAQGCENNLKLRRAPGSRLARLVLPEIHGVSRSHLQEFFDFSPSRWRREFAAAGLKLVAIKTGPVASGYGFGLDAARHALERMGVASEYIYIAVKQGRQSRYNRYVV